MRKISRRSFLAGAALCGAAAALTACGGSSAFSTAASSVAASSAAAGSAAAAGDSYTVGICQLVEHAALDAATQGFEDALSAEFGENVTFDFQNAQNDSATCATIANGFVSAGVDLIMANATPALQAAQAATNEIPILGTSVTEYGVALGLTDFTGTVGGNVSGTSDLAPLDQQAEMITEWLPEATKVGLLYCSAEANSQYQVDEVKKYLEDKGIEVIDVGTNSTESFNYPISGYKVGKMVASGEVDGGVLICGTGVGISLAANKVKGVRACVCSEPYSARLSKQHNNSNIIAFGARVIGVEMAKMIVDEWVNAKYEGGRHQVRVDMLTEIEQTQGLKVVDEQGQ